MRINYDSLTKIVASQKPYRGRPNHYPTHGNSYRRHSHKFFKPDVIDNDIVFRINYGNIWNRINCTEDEAKMLEKLGKQVQYTDKFALNEVTQKHEATGEREYFYYEIMPDELGIVHSDNTFEFTHEGSLGQGSRHYLNDYCFDYTRVYTDCRKGGVILDHKYPLFKGLRINLDTMKPAENQELELFKTVVNRSAAKELYAPYKEMISVSKVMFSQMSDEVFTASLKDVLNDHKIVWEWDDEEGHNRKFTSGKDIVKIADKLREEGSYFDSAMLYGYGYDLNGVTWRVRHGWGYHSNKTAFMNMDKSLRKIIYQHRKPFDLIPIEFGSGSTSQWGFAIKHNGLFVSQYRC